MTLFNDSVFLTNDVEGFRKCRETRSESSTTVLLCTGGYIEVFYRNKMLRINKGDVFIRVPHATELGPYHYTEDFKFMMISIPISLFEGLMFGNLRVEPNWWAKQQYLKENPIFRLNDVSIDFCKTYFHLMELQMKDKMSAYRKQIMMLIARGATMELLNYLDKKVAFEFATQDLPSNAGDYTFHSFLQSLREHPHEREVQWHAEQLGITPKYLSEICKDCSGKSASRWIAEITVAEIHHYLRETTLPIHEVAKKMEFPNASFFCQYTKKHTGFSPNHFRKEKEA